MIYNSIINTGAIFLFLKQNLKIMEYCDGVFVWYFILQYCYFYLIKGSDYFVDHWCLSHFLGIVLAGKMV